MTTSEGEERGFFDGIIHWSLTHRFVVIIAYVFLVAAGVAALRSMHLDVFPEFAPPQVVIQTEAAGLSPTDVEALITFRLESAVNGTPGVTDVRSSSSVGLSTITVVFEWGTDVYRARQLIAERVQAVRANLPTSAQPPQMLPVTSAVGWLVKFALVSDKASPLDLRTLCDWDVKNRVLAVPGVASVVCLGGGEKQYQVQVSPRRLALYGLSFEDVRRAVANANANFPGGFIESASSEYVVTGIGRVQSVEDLAGSLVTRRGETPVTIGDVAEVTLGAAVKRGDATYDGKPAVIGTISKAFGADTLSTTYRVEDVLRQVESSLPPGVTMHSRVFRQATFIERSVENLKGSLVEGILIVAIVLFLFLFNARTSIISLTAIPMSLFFGLLVLKAFGIGINAMTLGGLAIAIGEVVDDSIIDVENVFHRLRENGARASPRNSLAVIFDASREIRNSVIYATLIVILVFMPIFFLSGVEGRMFTPLGIAYIAAILSSLVVALTLTPVMCHLLLGGSGRAAPAARESATVRALKGGYSWVLARVLPRFWWVVGTSVALVLAAMVMFSRFGTSFLPEFHEGNFILAMSTLPGTNLKESVRLGNEVTRILREHPEVKSVAQRAGRGELDEDAQPPNFSEFDVTLDFGKTDPDKLVYDLREQLERVPGTAMNLGQFIAHRIDEVLSGVRAQVAIKVFGPDLDELRRVATQVNGIVAGVPGTVDLVKEPQVDVPEVQITFDRAKAARYGLTVGGIGQELEAGLSGLVTSQVLEGQRSFDLALWFSPEVRRDPQSLKAILLDAPGGTKVPLGEVAEVVVRPAPYVINREAVQRRIVVQCNVAGRDLGSFIRDVQQRVGAQVKLRSGYHIEYGGQFESQERAQRVLWSLGILAVLGIAVLLFSAFGSPGEAVLVMVNLPLALIGGVVAVWLTGGVVSIASLIGFVTLFGIASRNGIILVSHYHQLTAAGEPVGQVVLEGSLDRLTPVLMTAATAALGLLPLLWGSPTGKEIERPLAIVLLGGLVTSTFLNLIVVPTLYNRLARWRVSRNRSGTQEQAT